MTEILAKHHIMILSAGLLQNTGREAVPKKPCEGQEWGIDSFKFDTRKTHLLSRSDFDHQEVFVWDPADAHLR